MSVLPNPTLPHPEPLLVYESEAEARLVAALEAQRFEPFEWCRLRAEAERMDLIPGFDALLGLDLNRIDEYPHQVEVAGAVLRRMRGRALLADEVGLGKTIEAGLIMKEYLLRGLARRILVLVPPSLVFQWQQEMETKFDERFDIVREEEEWPRHDRIIASLDTAKRSNHAEVLAGIEWDLVIIDEAHRLRNRDTQAWAFVNRLRRKYLLMLTATPVHNELEELYNLVTLLKPGLLGTPQAFRERFVNPDDPRRPVRERQLKALLQEVMVRNRRSKVSVKFPARKAYVYSVELTKEEQTLYTAMADLFRRLHAQSKGPELLRLLTLELEVCSSSFALVPTLEKLCSQTDSPPEVVTALKEFAERARAITSPAKFAAAERIIEKAKDKVLVFTEFRATQAKLAETLVAGGVNALTFHGQMSPKEKEKAIEEFRKDGQVLVSTESGGEGRNLQFCNVMINYDLPWNPMLVEQRIGRLHRLGQTREVYVFNLAAKGTVESYVLDLLANKIRMFELVVGELDLILGSLETDRTFDAMVKDIWLTSPTPEEMQQRFDKLGERITQARDRFSDIKEAELIVSRIFD